MVLLMNAALVSPDFTVTQDLLHAKHAFQVHFSMTPMAFMLASLVQLVNTRQLERSYSVSSVISVWV